MILPEKKEFLKELNDDIKYESGIKEKIIDLYDHAVGIKKVSNATIIAEDIIIKIFKSKYSNDILIPFNFIKSSIGKVVFTVIFDSREKVFTVKDLIELTKSEDKPEGYTKQYINQEIREGNLKGKGVKKGGRWLFTENEVYEYLKFKGFDIDIE